MSSRNANKRNVDVSKTNIINISDDLSIQSTEENRLKIRYKLVSSLKSS